MNKVHPPVPNYPVRVFWSDEDAAWIAICGAFPYVAAFGETREQVMRDIAPLLDEAVHTYAQEGWPLPEPDLEPTASGQTRLRLPRALHDRVIERARIDGVSLNTFVVAAVAEKVGLAQGLLEMRAIRDDIANLIARQHMLIDSRANSRTYESRQEPRAGLIAEQILDDVSLAAERIRVHVQFSGVPVAEPGRYEFRIFERAAGAQKWKALHRVPFQVAVGSHG